MNSYLKQKKENRYMYTSMNRTNNLIVKRGDIFYADLPVYGSVQGGCRPVVIISNDMNNKFSPTVQIIPLTSQQKKKNLPVHVCIDEIEGMLAKKSQALVEQLTTVDKCVLMSKKGSLSTAIINQIESAIRIQFGFAG